MGHIPFWFFFAAVPAVLAFAAPAPQNHKSVLILGGGVAGIIAARSLHEKGIHDFLIVEARDELGGRLHSMEFGADGRRATIELGANWIQGTQEGLGPANPILTLAQKHGVEAVESDFYDSISGSHPFLIWVYVNSLNLATYDETGPVDYFETFNKAVDAYTNLTIAGGGLRIRSRRHNICFS
jgi:polyamine oxidase